LEKQTTHFIENSPKTPGVRLFAQVQLLQRNESHEEFQFICFS